MQGPLRMQMRPGWARPGPCVPASVEVPPPPCLENCPCRKSSLALRSSHCKRALSLEEKKIFCIYGHYPVIRAALLRKGWVEKKSHLLPRITANGEAEAATGRLCPSVSHVCVSVSRARLCADPQAP